MGSLFYQALDNARHNAPGDNMADKLAKIALIQQSPEITMQAGLTELREFVAKDNSTFNLQTTLPVFADFFGYIY